MTSNNKSNDDEQSAQSHQYNEAIINQLLELQIGTKSQIISAMQQVQNKNNIEEIAEYLMSMNDKTNSTQQNKENQQSDKINTLTAMGYDLNLVKKALEISNNNIQTAAQQLIDGLIDYSKLKGIEFDDVNDKKKIYKGALIQIVGNNHKNPVIDYWNESNIGASFHSSLRGLVGIITFIDSNNQTIKIETSDEKQHIVPIKACLAIKYETKTDRKDKVLVTGYIHCWLDTYNKPNVPPLIVQLCYEFYHVVRLRLVCDDCKEKEILITRNACKLSNYLNSINILNNSLSALYIADLKYDVMELVVKWLCYHNGIEPKTIPKPITSLVMKEIVGDIWDADYINCMSKKTIFQVVLAANNLQITHLLNLGSAKIATLIKGRSPEEIRQILADDD